MMQRLTIMIVLFLGAILFSSCGDRAKKTVHYTVTSIEVEYNTENATDGYFYHLRNHETGHPAYLYDPELRFSKGEEIVMKRTKKEVMFTSMNNL